LQRTKSAAFGQKRKSAWLGLKTARRTEVLTTVRGSCCHLLGLVGDRLQNQLIRKIKNVPRRREAKHTELPRETRVN
jgi:hypothetical protein